MTLSNCTITRNQCRVAYKIGTQDQGSSYGGGIEGSGTTVTNCTISHNVAASGTPNIGDAAGGGIDGGATLTNTIVSNSGRAGNCSCGTTSGGHNLSSDATCFSSGGSDRLSTNPHLAPLGNYGGATQTMALCTGPGNPRASCTAASPAIDAGDDAVTGPPDNLSTDQRGLPRLSGAHVDIGAYEVQ